MLSGEKAGVFEKSWWQNHGFLLKSKFLKKNCDLLFFSFYDDFCSLKCVFSKHIFVLREVALCIIGCAQCSTRTRTTRHPATTRACPTPGQPSLRRRTASRAPLTLTRSRWCRTWAGSTWWDHAALRCSRVQQNRQCVQADQHVSSSSSLLLLPFYSWTCWCLLTWGLMMHVLLFPPAPLSLLVLLLCLHSSPPPGCCLDHEVLSLREAACHGGPGQHGPYLGVEDGLWLLQQHAAKVQHWR